MPIKTISTFRLSNSEHFIYMTEVKHLVETAGSSYLDIENIFSSFTKLYKEEKLLQNKVSESLSSSKIEGCMVRRHDLLQGIINIVTGYTYHAHQAKKDAAKAIQHIIQKQGDLESLSTADDVIVVTVICNELSRNIDLVQLLNLEEWVIALEKENHELHSLVNNKCKLEIKDRLDIKNIRFKLDKSYNDLITRIRAYNLLRSDLKYTNFISCLNKITNHFLKNPELEEGRRAHVHSAGHHYSEAFY